MNCADCGELVEQDAQVLSECFAGNERVYHSLDELPPEVRAAIEQAQKQSPQ